jgi:predicted CoA-binding protein
MSSPVQVLRDTRSVLVIDWPSADVPDALASHGFDVIVKGGRGPDTFSRRTTGPDGQVVTTTTASPAHVDLVYFHRPLDELPGIVVLARELGATAVWYQSGVTEDGARDPKACWLSDADRHRARGVVEAAGLAWIDGVYIADAVRESNEPR